MKNRLAIFALFVIFSAFNLLAAGSVTVSGPTNLGYSGVFTYTFTWTGDASTGAVPTTYMSTQSMDQLKGWHLYLVKTYPGTPAPTAAYDVDIYDSDNDGLMGTALHDRSASAIESAKPPNIAIPIQGRLRVAISNQSVAGGKGVVTLFFVKDPVSIGGVSTLSGVAGTVTANQGTAGAAGWLVKSIPAGTLVSGVSTAITTTTSTQVIAGVASNYLYVWCSARNTHETVSTLVNLQNGSGGATIWTLAAPSDYSGEVDPIPMPIKIPTAGNGLFAAPVTTGASVIVTCRGFYSTASY